MTETKRFGIKARIEVQTDNGPVVKHLPYFEVLGLSTEQQAARAALGIVDPLGEYGTRVRVTAAAVPETCTPTAAESKSLYVARRVPELLKEDYYEELATTGRQNVVKRAASEAAAEWREHRCHDHTEVVPSQWRPGPVRLGPHFDIRAYSNDADPKDQTRVTNVSGMAGLALEELAELHGQIGDVLRSAGYPAAAIPPF